jgi:steroid delta-isomerase-like uncharacterized protein
MTAMPQASPSVGDVVSRQFEAINRHDAASLGSTYGSQATVWDPQYPELLRGREAIVRDFTEFFAGFPDLKLSIERTLAVGEEYAVEFVMKGTHKGALITPTGQIPATNKSIQVGGCVVGRIDSEGRIVDERRYYDFAGMLGQLGLLQ